MPIIAWATIGRFLKSPKFLIPAAIVTILLAIGGGVYFYLDKSTAKQVEDAVTNANAHATTQTYETNDEVNQRFDEIDARMDKLQTQTTKDYENVRTRIIHAPAEAKAQPVPPLVIDTLNELDRLRSERDSGGVPDPEVPVG